ncbi:zf-HC2 domain-containing protein [candidate division TA06 bacterium]|uniref:Zf-HC2 domain-containing protein n=1 Tax=candidate division TA06 bacterium TaxID=2250710 RepID=A0A933IA34_UNCT6|nr:zf-HC2 domain-containing protein [candidate division TA06 bacterium]
MKKNDQHKFTPEQIGAYYDGQLTEPERRDIEQHIERCPLCRELLTDLNLMDKAIGKAEHISAPDGYFDTFGSAVANRIARQKLEPQKQAKRFNWGWITTAAALASLAIVLITGDLTKSRLYRSFTEKQKTVPSEAPVRSEAPIEAETKDQAPAQRSKSREASPELILAEVPAEKEARDEAPTKPARKMEAAPELNLSEVSLKQEAPAATPAKRAGKTALPRSLQAVGSAGISDKKDKAAKSAAVQSPVKLASAPAPASVSLAPSQASPSSVESVTVIEICLPGDDKDCPEPQVKSAIQINLDGI